jgi:hypothetical protein
MTNNIKFKNSEIEVKNSEEMEGLLKKARQNRSVG